MSVFNQALHLALVNLYAPVNDSNYSEMTARWLKVSIADTLTGNMFSEGRGFTP